MRRVAKVFIGIIYLVLVKPMLWFLRILRHSRRHFNIVVYYHSIRDAERLRFRRQLFIIRALTTPIPIGFPETESKSRRYLMISFDDAFQSVHRNAVPELSDQNVPFTIFVPSGKLGLKADWGKYQLGFVEDVISGEELYALPTELAIIGSHTASHKSVIGLSKEDAYEEIKGSKVSLEKLLNRDIEYFAFPFGDYDEQGISICHDSGYKQVFTTEKESPFSPIRIFKKGRTAVDPSDWYVEVALKVLGAYDWLRTYMVIKQFTRRLFKRENDN